MGCGRIEPSTFTFFLSSAQKYQKNLVGREGIEPSTSTLYQQVSIIIQAGYFAKSNLVTTKPIHRKALLI